MPEDERTVAIVVGVASVILLGSAIIALLVGINRRR